MLPPEGERVAAEDRPDGRPAARRDRHRQQAADTGEGKGAERGEPHGKAEFGFDAQHPGEERLARRCRLVLHLGDAPVATAELAGDGGFVGQQAEGGAIEAVRFEREDGLLECLRIVEQGDDLTERRRHRNARLFACRAKPQSPAQVVRR